MAAGAQAVTRDPPSRSLASRLFRSVVRITAASFIGATLFLVTFEKRFIYYPSTDVGLTPREMGLPFEDVALEVEAGVRVHGWFIKADREPSNGTVLFSHGNAGNIALRLDRAMAWRKLGVDFLLYDYRGFGRSTGDPDEEGTYRDGRAAFDYLVNTRSIDPSRIILMGESLGCAVTVQTALDRKAAAVVLEAPFASIARMASAVFPFLPVQLFVRTKYDNLAKIARISRPLLVVQGTKDEVIPVEQGRLVFDAALEPKKYLGVEGAHHNDVYIVGGASYLKALSDFIKAVIPPVENP